MLVASIELDGPPVRSAVQWHRPSPPAGIGEHSFCAPWRREMTTTRDTGNAGSFVVGEAKPTPQLYRRPASSFASRQATRACYRHVRRVDTQSRASDALERAEYGTDAARGRTTRCTHSAAEIARVLIQLRIAAGRQGDGTAQIQLRARHAGRSTLGRLGDPEVTFGRCCVAERS